MNTLHQLTGLLRAKQRTVPTNRAMLVAISGIDASGKGHMAAQLAPALRRFGLRTVVLNVDGWLNLPGRRFDEADPGPHFYEHALRLDEMFRQLVLPLRDNRRIRVTTDFTEEAATTYRKHTYDFPAVDVILLEGIFLLKPAYRGHYDSRVWIDCTFETALERAVARAQEGLPPAETIRAYESIYFPAQRLHFERDQPRAAVDFILPNDNRLQETATTKRCPEPVLA